MCKSSTLRQPHDESSFYTLVQTLVPGSEAADAPGASAGAECKSRGVEEGAQGSHCHLGLLCRSRLLVLIAISASCLAVSALVIGLIPAAESCAVGA